MAEGTLKYNPKLNHPPYTLVPLQMELFLESVKLERAGCLSESRSGPMTSSAGTIATLKAGIASEVKYHGTCV